jgi:hypothetical protein
VTTKKEFQQAQDLAMQAATVAYLDTIQTELAKIGITDFVERLDGETHIHQAVGHDEKGTRILVTTRWDFTTHPARIEDAFNLAKKIADET